MSPGDVPLLTAFDAAPCALARTDAKGIFLRVNATFVDWLGYEPEELIGKRRVQELLTMGGKIFHQTHWAPLLQMQGSVSEVRLEMVHKDRSPVPMIMNAVRRERDGVIVHDLAAFVARDRDKFEQELVASRNKLQQAIAEGNILQALAKDRALFAEQMVGIVSHDLRTPLSVVSMSTQVLRRGEVSADQRRVLERILRAASRAERMIADLLDFTQARLGSGLACTPKWIDANAVVADTLDELSQAFADRQLRYEPKGTGSSFIDGDRLAQMTVNLVSNAMAYGDVSRPVTVFSDSSGGAFLVAVHNHGIPIAPEAIQALFQPMVRGEGLGTGVRSVGLGLYIVSEIVKSHGGTIEVSSDAFVGTIFSARFPLQPM